MITAYFCLLLKKVNVNMTIQHKYTCYIYIYTSIEGIVYEYCKIDVTCVYIGHVFYVLYYVVITRQSNLFHNSTVRVMNSRVSGQCSSTITYYNIQCKF